MSNLPAQHCAGVYDYFSAVGAQEMAVWALQRESDERSFPGKPIQEDIGPSLTAAQFAVPYASIRRRRSNSSTLLFHRFSRNGKKCFSKQTSIYFYTADKFVENKLYFIFNEPNNFYIYKKLILKFNTSLHEAFIRAPLIQTIRILPDDL